MQGKSLLGIATLALALIAADADAATINVRPGPNAIQKAVDRANPGDRLLVRRGKYREDVQVDKRLKIVGTKGKRPVIDGRCETDRTIDIMADGIRLRHLKVKGARFGPGGGYAVNVIGVESGTLRDLVLRESCNQGPAYYGVNVFDTGALEITEVRATGGFVDAGIYVGSIGDVGARPFLVARNEAFGNNVGILMEDSGPEANFVVRANRVHDNHLPGLSDPAGILVRRSDGGVYARNRANGNGDYGIHLDPDSEDNRLTENRAFGNGSANFFDQGSGNCGSGNSFPIAPCP
jgi:parallel beta-helix repeat protein